MFRKADPKGDRFFRSCFKLLFRNHSKRSSRNTEEFERSFISNSFPITAFVDVEKELQNLKREEQKLIGQIKACARQGNDASTRIMAKSLIRIRQQITKLTAGNAHLKTVSTQMTVKPHSLSFLI